MGIIPVHGRRIHFKELEYQICRMDICYCAFLKHLDSLLQAIGEMKPYKDLEGCGSYDSSVRDYIENKFSGVCSSIRGITRVSTHLVLNKNKRIELWLHASLALAILLQSE